LNGAFALRRFVRFTLLLLTLATAASGAEVDVSFRYDDYSAVSPTEFERELFSIFAAQEVTLAVGAIPFACADVRDSSPQDLQPIPQQKCSMLVEAAARGTVEILLHGYSHQTHVPSRPFSEFSGLPAAEQRRRIVEGRQWLQEVTGQRISLFAPPWHSYDHTTLSVLDSLGFDGIAANAGGVSDPSLGLRYLPETCDLAHAREAIELATRTDDEDPWVIIGFHAYNFEESSDRGYTTLDELSELLAWIGEKDGVSVTPLSALATRDADTRRLQAHQRLVDSRRWLPAFARGQNHRVYRAPSGSDRMTRRVQVSVAAIYAGPAAAFVVALLAIRRLRRAR